MGADVLKQIICNVKVRRAPTTRHDNIDFAPIVTRISKIKSLSVVVADKAYDSVKTIMYLLERILRNSVLYHQDMKKMCKYGKQKADIEKRWNVATTSFYTISATRRKLLSQS